MDALLQASQLTMDHHTMSATQYQLWLAVYNAGIKQGLASSQALAEADRAAAAIA